MKTIRRNEPVWATRLRRRAPFSKVAGRESSDGTVSQPAQPVFFRALGTQTPAIEGTLEFRNRNLARFKLSERVLPGTHSVIRCGVHLLHGSVLYCVPEDAGFVAECEIEHRIDLHRLQEILAVPFWNDEGMNQTHSTN